MMQERARDVAFRKAALRDIKEESQLAQIVSGKAAGAMSRKMFLERNPECDFHLYDRASWLRT